MSELVLQKGILQCKLPGMKDWNMYYLKVTPTHLHIMDEHGRRHLRSLEIDHSDICGEDSKFKKEFRFYLLRGDGKYGFKCDNAHEKNTWIEQLRRVIQKKSSMEVFEAPSPDALSPSHLSPPPSNSRGFGLPQVAPSRSKKSVLDTPLPSAPGMSTPRASVISTDSGIGASEGGEVKRGRQGFRSAPSSGDGRFKRGPAASSKSGDSTFGRPPVQVLEEGSEINYEKCKWFWGTTSRQEAERRLLSEGKIGNFIVRINASGHYVMTYWRSDGIHHHKILNHGTIYRFEKSAVEAEGESLVDLLDTYMKKNSSKTKPMEPYGGALYEMYNYAWTPPTFDMNLLEERLKEQKRLREEAKASQRPGQYTPIDLADSSGSSREDSGSATISTQPPPPAAKARGKTLPQQPAKKPPMVSDSKFSGSLEEPAISKKKPLPPTPNKKPAVGKGGGASLIQELKNASLKSDKSSPRTKAKPKPKPPTKPGKPSKELSQPSLSTPASHPTTSYEPPEYANCDFGEQPDSDEPQLQEDDESLYMNVNAAPAPPVRRPRVEVTQPPPSEYQNIGTHVSSKNKRRQR